MKFTGKHVFLMVSAFFLIIFIANGFLVYYAMNSFSGLETENPYERGVAYNSDIARAKQQNQSGLDVKIKIATQPDRIIGVTVSAMTAAGEPVSGKKLSIRFFRPAKHGIDQTPRIFENQPGIYSGQAQLPLAGVWDLKLDIFDGDKQLYQTKSRIEVK